MDSVGRGTSAPSPVLDTPQSTPVTSQEADFHGLNWLDYGNCMKKMKALLTLSLLAWSCAAYAEGGCPVGQYPVGGQGVQGCAPIPGGGGGGDLQPNGRWIKTWGAIYQSDATGAMGASVGKRTKAEAEKEAKDRCTTYGASDCMALIAYNNQCVAYAYPKKSSGGGRVSAVRGPTKEVASTEVLKLCAARNESQCEVLYSDCTEPLFHSY